jgi:hypothetical protein
VVNNNKEKKKMEMLEEGVHGNLVMAAWACPYVGANTPDELNKGAFLTAQQ